MSDVNANIGVNIDTSAALDQLKALQRQISQFHSSVAKSSEAAALAQRDLQRNFVNSVNAIGAFSAELRTVKTTAESFTTSLEGNKLSMREYFRYAGAATKTFGKAFKSEFDTIGKVAEERVKTLQTQYIKMGRDATGAMKAIAIRPLTLDMNNLSTQTQIAAQKQAIFNQLIKQGSTSLLNFGKNTQWAGRQLMVGFTLPLAAFGQAAAKSFKTLETEVIRFRKVYGDLGTNQVETEAALKNIRALADGYTKYGVEVSKTVGLASQAAAAGFKNADLIAQTDAATKLAILGQIEQQQALETTISLQNAFKISSTELATTIDFLNAVENQTVTSLDDITTAIPKVAPVIQSLGGDVKDLAFFLTAMKEGGVNASEGANALKSGLASLINPSKKANAMLADMGININGIVNKNKGNLKATVVEFAKELDRLDPLARARAIETMFGKFQFARISTLMKNVIQSGNQASRVLDLAGQSAGNLASLTEKELGVTSASALIKFESAVAKLKASLAPVGEVFMKAFTPVIDFVTKVLDKFNNLSDGTKKFVAITAGVIGGLGPILLMTFGLLANGVANIMKLFLTLRTGYQRLTGQSQNLGEQTQYLTSEQLDAAAAAHSLEQAHATLTQQFTVEAGAVNQLRMAYERAIVAAKTFAMSNPGMMKTPALKKFATGTPGVVTGPGTGTSDSIIARVSNGEAIIPAAVVSKHPDLINSLVADNLPGFPTGRGTKLKGGTTGPLEDIEIKAYRNATIYLQDWINQQLGSSTGASMQDVIASLRQSGGAAASPLLAVMADSMGVSVEDPTLHKDFEVAGKKLIESSISALEKSGKTLVTDLDLENIVVPAMRKEAETINIGGKQAAAAINSAIDDIRTVAMVGSGTGSSVPRTSLGKSYIDFREKAQALAVRLNPFAFRKGERPSKSSETGTKPEFQMKNVPNTLPDVLPELGTLPPKDMPEERKSYLSQRIALNRARKRAQENSLKEYTGAQAAHIMPGITASVKEIEVRTKAIIANAHDRLIKFAEKVAIETGRRATKGVAQGAETASNSQASKRTGKYIDGGLAEGMIADEKIVTAAGKKIGVEAVQSVDVGAKEALKKRRVATRTQGPAQIGPSMPENAMSLPIVAALTEQEKLAAKKENGNKTKDAGKSRFGLSGRGMAAGAGLMVGSMALSALPEFTGKALAQSTANMAAMGAMFGVWGAAAGAAIGLVTAGITSLVEMHRKHEATVKATYTASADVISMFGGTMLDQTAKIHVFATSVKDTNKELSELQKRVNAINKLKNDNPLKLVADSLKGMSSESSVVGTVRQFAAAQVANGMDSSKVKDLITTLLTYAGKTEYLKKAIDSVTASTKNSTTATGTWISKLRNAARPLSNLDVAYDGLTKQQKRVADAALLVASRILDSKTSYEDAIRMANALSKALGGTAQAYQYLIIAANKSDIALGAQLTKLRALGASFAEAQIFLKAAQSVPMKPGQTEEARQKQILDAVKKDLEKTNADIQKQNAKDRADYAAKVANLKTAEKANSKSALEIAKAELKVLQKKLQAQQDATAELKNQQDYLQKQASLDAEILDAKIHGNYVLAEQLRQQQANNTVDYNNQNALTALEKQIAAKQDEVDKLQADKDKKDNIIASAGPAPVATPTIDIKGALDRISRMFNFDKSNPLPVVVVSGAGSMTPTQAIDGKTVGAAADKALQQRSGVTRTSTGDSVYVFEWNGKQYAVDNAGVIQEWNPQTLSVKGKPIRRDTTKKADGGYISGSGTTTSDSIPAMLSNKEYVVNASAVDKYGVGFFDQLNAKKFATGGPVEKKNGNFFSRFNPVNMFSSYLSGMMGMGASKIDPRVSSYKSTVSQTEKDRIALLAAQGVSGYTSAFNLKNNTSPEIFGHKGLGVAADVLGVLPAVGLAGKLGMGTKSAIVPKVTVHAAMDDKFVPKLPQYRPSMGNNYVMQRVIEQNKAFAEAQAVKTSKLSEDTVSSIKKYQQMIADHRTKIKDLESGKFFKDNTWAKPEDAQFMIENSKTTIADALKLLKLSRKTDTPPGGINALDLYTQKPMYAQKDDWGVINSLLTRKPMGEDQVVYRGLSLKDMADIVGHKTVPNKALQNGKAWMDKFGYNSMTEDAPWSHFTSRWKENAADLIKASGKPEPRYDSPEAAPFKEFDKGLNVGQSWIPDMHKSFTDNLDWAKVIATQGGTGGGQAGAIAKVILGKDVRGMKNLMDLGLGGYFKDATAKEQYVAAYTEFVLKAINPLAVKIPAEGGHFIGEGASQQWVGPSASKLLDEYVFEAKRTLPSPHIPHFGTAGPRWNQPNAFQNINKPKFARGGQVTNYSKNFQGEVKPTYQGGTMMGPAAAWQEAHKEIIKIKVPPIRSNFSTNSYDLNKKQRLELQKLASQLIDNNIKSIVVQGHADSRGGVDNDLLSLNRAKATASYLSKFAKGIKFMPIGFGTYEPLAPNTNATNMAKNRRAELFLPDQYKTVYPEFNPEKFNTIIQGGGEITSKGTIGYSGPNFGKIIDAAKSKFGFAKGGMVNFNIPSYDVGTDYVPADTLAMVHKGERIIPADQNKTYNDGGMTNHFIINGTDLNKKEIADEIMVRLDRVQRQNNKTNKVMM